jgi:hypothetical protein
MGALNLGPDGQGQGGHQARSYIPPHMRNRPQGAQNGPPPPVNGAPAAVPDAAGAPMNGGLGNSNWAK